MIEMLHSFEDSGISGATLVWRGMNIYLVAMLNNAGEKCLSVTLGDASNAKVIAAGHTGIWTILPEAEAPSDAVACTTLGGAVRDATSNDTGGH